MKVLVVVDMQNDFITGSLGTPEAQAIVPNVKKKIEEAVKNGDQIIYTRDTHWDDYLESREGKKLPVEHCIRGTHGWQIPTELLPPDEYEKKYILDKETFGSEDLGWALRALVTAPNGDFNCDEIELVGLCTDICVVSNALLLKAGYYGKCEISVDATCCAGVTPETHEAALKTMEMCQINVKR
jgi:nicotinamidase-related amidase